METPKGIAIRQEVWGCTTQLTSEVGWTCRGRSLHSWTLMLTTGPTSDCSAVHPAVVKTESNPIPSSGPTDRLLSRSGVTFCVPLHPERASVSGIY